MKRYATCRACKQKMRPGVECTANPGGNRIPWGSETSFTDNEFPELTEQWKKDPWNCHDCNTAPGGLHHPGCDTEECPICHQQALGCRHAHEGGVFTA